MHSASHYAVRSLSRRQVICNIGYHRFTCLTYRGHYCIISVTHSSPQCLLGFPQVFETFRRSLLVFSQVCTFVVCRSGNWSLYLSCVYKYMYALVFEKSVLAYLFVHQVMYHLCWLSYIVNELTFKIYLRHSVMIKNITLEMTWNRIQYNLECTIASWTVPVLKHLVLLVFVIYLLAFKRQLYI